MAMLLQGECTAVGSSQAAKNFNFSKSRYYQIRNAFTQQGVAALVSKKTGPKRNYRRTPEITKLVIRCRFLDPKASSEVIASKLRQDGHIIATRSVERIISDYGLQKKLHLQFPAPATKQIQTFFVVDADSQQPICFTLGSSSRNTSRATVELLKMAALRDF